MHRLSRWAIPTRIVMIALCACTIWSENATAGDRSLNGTEISALLTEARIAGERDGSRWRQEFSENGSTVYHAEGRAPSRGRWTVRGDRYCSEWPPSPGWACYDVVDDGAAFAFIAEDGARWPFAVVR